MTTYSVTEAFVNWLSGLGYKASTYPPDSESEFVTVERTGGAMEDKIDHPAIAIQTWAQTEPRAEEMANNIRLSSLTSRPAGVASIRVDSLYPFWDSSTRLPRYQLVLDCAAEI